jgi:hypothetical protein
MSGRVVSDIQTRAEGESLYMRYNTDANVVNGLKNDSSYEFIGEVPEFTFDTLFRALFSLTL